MRRNYKVMAAMVTILALDIYTAFMYFKEGVSGIVLETWLRYLIGLNITVAVFAIILTILNRRR